MGAPKHRGLRRRPKQNNHPRSIQRRASNRYADSSLRRGETSALPARHMSESSLGARNHRELNSHQYVNRTVEEPSLLPTRHKVIAEDAAPLRLFERQKIFSVTLADPSAL